MTSLISVEYDIKQKIPQINDCDIENNILIVVSSQVFSTISVGLEQDSGIKQFCGMIHDGKNLRCWSDPYNGKKTKSYLRLMMYKVNEQRHTNHSFFVLSTFSDIDEFCQKYYIPDGMCKQFLYGYLDSIKYFF